MTQGPACGLVLAVCRATLDPARIRLRTNTWVVQAAPLVDWSVKSSIPPWGFSARVSVSISTTVNEKPAAADGVDVRDVPEEVRADGAQETPGLGSLAGVGLDRLEKVAIRQTLAMTGGNREQAAQLLGIGERTLYRKLKEYGLR